MVDGRPLTPGKMNKLMRQLLTGFMRADGTRPPLARLSSHSLRAGGATALFASGASATLIAQLGRWASDAYLGYCRLTAAVTRGVSALMMRASAGGLDRTMGEAGPGDEP